MTPLRFCLVLGGFIILLSICVFISHIPGYWLADSFASIAPILAVVSILWFFAAPALIKGFKL